jgi:uncharacterized protein (DUF2164 family)
MKRIAYSSQERKSLRDKINDKLTLQNNIDINKFK